MTFISKRQQQYKLQVINILILIFIIESKSELTTSNSSKKRNNNQQQDVVKHILHNLSTSSTTTPPATWINDEDATILDVFGQVAKDFLTNRLVSTSKRYTYCMYSITIMMMMIYKLRTT